MKNNLNKNIKTCVSVESKIFWINNNMIYATATFVLADDKPSAFLNNGMFNTVHPELLNIKKLKIENKEFR